MLRTALDKRVRMRPRMVKFWLTKVDEAVKGRKEGDQLLRTDTVTWNIELTRGKD